MLEKQNFGEVDLFIFQRLQKKTNNLYLGNKTLVMIVYLLLVGTDYVNT